MAEFNFGIAVALGVQSVAGTIDATIAALTGSLVEADGIVLGSPEAGIAESGIDFEVERDLVERAVVSGSFTKQASIFVSEKIAKFSIAFPLGGRGGAFAVDADYQPAKGIDALIQSMGFAGAAWGSGLGWRYVPASAQAVSAKLWLSGVGAYTIKDLVAESWELDQTPGEPGILTVNLKGDVNSWIAAAAFPTLNYGNQASVSPPAVKGVGHNWGMSAAARGFSEATLSGDQEVEELPDSNAATGIRSRQTGRTITFKGKIIADSADGDFERTTLVLTSAPTQQQQWQVGTAGAANAYRITLATPEIRVLKPDRLGAVHQNEVELVATNTGANGEAELIFN